MRARETESRKESERDGVCVRRASEHVCVSGQRKLTELTVQLHAEMFSDIELHTSRHTCTHANRHTHAHQLCALF